MQIRLMIQRLLHLPLYRQIRCARCGAPTNLAYTSEQGVKVSMYAFQCGVCDYPNTVSLNVGNKK